MSEVLSNYDRWFAWMILEHGPIIESKLKELWDSYAKNRERFSKKHFYYGVGYDTKNEKYSDWDLCDIRENPKAIGWDVTMGFPYEDGVLETVKSKLTLGMMTYHQARFIIRETARCLKVGGRMDMTDRDIENLSKRQEELDAKMFIRYVYGSSLYYGSRRKSFWTPEWINEIASEYNLRVLTSSDRGMNLNMVLERTEGKLKKFTPEPKLIRDDEGNIRNEGGDFDYAYGEREKALLES